MLNLLPRAFPKCSHGKLHEAENQHRGTSSPTKLNFESSLGNKAREFTFNKFDFVVSSQYAFAESTKVLCDSDKNTTSKDGTTDHKTPSLDETTVAPKSHQ